MYRDNDTGKCSDLRSLVQVCRPLNLSASCNRVVLYGARAKIAAAE